MIRLGLIVEGDGEVEAFPLLVRRILTDQQLWGFETERAVKVGKSKLGKPGELERAMLFALRLNQRMGPVLICADADQDCPADLGPILKREAARVAGEIPTCVILAKHEFEAWFLAGAESLRGKRGLRSDFSYPDDPESRRGAKELLRKNMTQGRIYSPARDQAALVAALDMAQARRARSFDRCCREVLRVFLEFRQRV